jgi:hypothetical protein
MTSTTKQRKEALLSRREMEEMRARCERLTGVLTKPETLRMCSTLERAMETVGIVAASGAAVCAIGGTCICAICELWREWNRS